MSCVSCPRILVVVLCSAAAGAAEIQPVIDRPVTLPQGRIDLTLQGLYTNWAVGLYGLTDGWDGESLSAGLDLGVTDTVQVGVALALSVNPAAFGSVLGNVVFAPDPRFGVRVDGGYERIGVNGGTEDHDQRYFVGFGAPLKIPIAGTVAFVSGQSSAVRFGQFSNVGSSGEGLYSGATVLAHNSSDLLVIGWSEIGNSNSVALNLPLGLLVQPDPRVAITLQAGYSAIVSTSPGPHEWFHFVPVALEAVVSPMAHLDIGARFSLDGYVGTSDNRYDLGAGYFDLRALTFWFRVRA